MQIDASVVNVDMAISVRWPDSLGEVTERIRDTVEDRLPVGLPRQSRGRRQQRLAVGEAAPQTGPGHGTAAVANTITLSS
ncbi:hypothetical protein [Asanoa ferruginea]|uniref:hypothetical protein n=1 Tax=Asanoa ferruginea TaxID=53367 RepID=UPI000E267C82|nr:hypothetical protein [Asanoa ferruginea]